MKLFWEHKIEGEKIEFDNTPFIISRIQKLDCQFGTHYYKQKQGSSKRTHLQGTQKIGCTARVTVYSITLYPDFCVSKEKTSDLSCRRLKQKKKEKLCELRDVTSKGKPLSSIMKYYVILPGEEAHHEYQSHQFGSTCLSVE